MLYENMMLKNLNHNFTETKLWCKKVLKLEDIFRVVELYWLDNIVILDFVK